MIENLHEAMDKLSEWEQMEPSQWKINLNPMELLEATTFVTKAMMAERDLLVKFIGYINTRETGLFLFKEDWTEEEWVKLGLRLKIVERNKERANDEKMDSEPTGSDSAPNPG